MPLVIVRSAPVLRKVEGIDRRTEEELTNVGHRLREGVGDTVIAPARGALEKRHVHAVIAGRRGGRILAVVRVTRIRTAAVIRAGGHTRRHVLIHRDDEIYAARVLIADGDRAVAAELPF